MTQGGESFSTERLHTGLQKLEEVVPLETRLRGLRLICKILENIVNHPEEPKFLSVNRSSAAYRKKILLDGAPEGALIEAVLLSCGFAVYGSESRSSIGNSAGSEETLQLLPCVRSEDVAACLTLVVQRLHSASPSRPTTHSLSEAAAASSTSESLPTPSRRLPVSESPADIQLRTIREAHARRFENHVRGRHETDTPTGDEVGRRSSLASGNATNINRAPSGGRVSSFFTSLFRPASGRRGNGATMSTQRGSNSRMMTLRDLPPPIRRGG